MIVILNPVTTSDKAFEKFADPKLLKEFQIINNVLIIIQK